MARKVTLIVTLILAVGFWLGDAHAGEGKGADRDSKRRAAEQAEAARERAIEFVDDENYSAAIRELTEAIRLEPRNTESYILRGYCSLGIEAFGQAFLDFAEALRLDPENDDALEGREEVRILQHADAVIGLGDNDRLRAIQIATEAIELDPTDAEAFDIRAHLFWKEERFGEAIADFDQAIRLEPKNLGFYQGRAWAYHLQGDESRSTADFDQAIRLATEAIEAKPDDAERYVSRGFLQYLKHDYDRAIADYDEALRLNPGQELAKERRDSAIENKEIERELRETKALLKEADKSPRATEREKPFASGTKNQADSLYRGKPKKKPALRHSQDGS